jgi:hypothetical protein
MIKRIIKSIVGIMLLPVCFGSSIAFFNEARSLPAPGSPAWLFFGGALTYGALYCVSLKMKFFYVVGHEAVHALLVFLCGGSVKSFRATTQGGNVTATKTNALISLGPYIVPVYALALSLLFWAAVIMAPAVRRYAGVYFYLLGASVSFHFLMTIDSVRVEQPDIKENGYLFSFAVMYIINIGMLAGLLRLVAPAADFFEFVRQTGCYSRLAYLFVWEKILAGRHFLTRKVVF